MSIQTKQVKTRIKWDSISTSGKTDGLVVKIRTGRSVLFSNQLTTLRLRDPRAAARFEEIINEIATEASGRDQSQAIPGVPEMVRVSLYDRDVVIVWGFVPNGAKQRGRLIGEFRFVLMTMADLEGDALESVFDLDRLLRT